VLGSAFAIAKQPGALGNNIHTELVPADFVRLFHGSDGNGPVINLQPVLAGIDLYIEPAMNRIIFKQMSHGGCISQVIDGDHLDIGVIPGGSKNDAPDSAEPIYTHFYGHNISL
jgi:hypothetical protein